MVSAGKFVLQVRKFVTAQYVEKRAKIVNVVPLTDFVKYHAKLTRRRQRFGDAK